MGTDLKTLKARLWHRRNWPKQNEFEYRVFYINTPVADMSKVKIPALFSFNRFNFLSFKNKDFGHKNGKNWQDFIVAQLVKARSPIKNPSFRLIAHPRLFGYAFNPITFWLVYEESKLKAVLCEVHNTFKQNHNYLLHKDDWSEIRAEDKFSSKKALYVSPFTKMEGHYEFSFEVKEDSFSANINYFDSKRLILETAMSGEYEPTTNTSILKTALLYPLMTIMVVARIHYQAVKLYLKKVPQTLKTRPKDEYKNNQTTGSKKRS